MRNFPGIPEAKAQYVHVLYREDTLEVCGKISATTHHTTITAPTTYINTIKITSNNNNSRYTQRQRATAGGKDSPKMPICFFNDRTRNTTHFTSTPNPGPLEESYKTSTTINTEYLVVIYQIVLLVSNTRTY